MGTEKRARQKANRQLKIEQEEKAEKKDQVRQYATMAVIIAVALFGGLFLLSVATGNDDDEQVATETLEDALAEADAAEEANGEESAASDSEAAGDEAPAGEGLPCPAEDGSSEPVL